MMEFLGLRISDSPIDFQSFATFFVPLSTIKYDHRKKSRTKQNDQQKPVGKCDCV